MNSHTRIVCLVLSLLAALPVPAVVTNVAPSGVIIQTSGSLNNLLTPVHVIDGATNEGPSSPEGYWLGPAGQTAGYFILDLLNDYPISSIALYNTHGGGTENSGTAKFAISVSDTVGPNTVSLDRFYPFNGDLDDYSPNGVNAQAVDAFQSPSTAAFAADVPTAVKGITNSLSLSGAGESVEIPDPAGFTQPTVYSYSLWVKFPTNATQTPLTPASLIVRTASAGNENSTWSHQLRLNSAGTFEAYLWDGSQRTVTGTTVVQAGVWYHVAVSAQNGGLEHLYVNGVEEGTPAPVGTMWTGGGLTEVGTGSGGGFQPAPELISDLGIWYSVLSPSAIAGLAKGQSPLNVGAASGLTLINPKAVISGTLSNVTGQAMITPNVYSLSTPVTARYWRFDALSCEYTPSATNSIGLDEMELFADVAMPTLTAMPAIELSAPASPFPLMTTTNLLSKNWVPVEGTPLFNGTTFNVSGTPTLSGTNFVYFETPTNPAAFYALPGPANGQTITTNVARGGNITYVSSFYTGPSFPPSCVIDGDTLESSNVCAIQPPSYWLGVNGDDTANFVLDLQREYSISSISLFNTHNGSCNDRGTAQFNLDKIDGLATNQFNVGAVDRYYPFDGDLTDHSTNKIDAVLLDGPNGNVITGAYSSDFPAVIGSGKSIVLSGDGSRIEIDDVTDPTTGQPYEPTAYTLSLWVKFNDLSQAMNLIVRTSGSGSESNTYSHAIRVLPTGQFQSYLWVGSPASVLGTTMAQTGVWYHVAATAMNGDWEHLYVNGKEEGTPAKVGAMWTGGDRWTVGAGAGDGSSLVPGFAPMLGKVDDLAIWFEALTAAQVQALYSGSKPTAIVGTTNALEFVNPRSIASGTLSDVSNQIQITPDVFAVNPPITARYLHFEALSSTYSSGNVGLNEIQVFSTIPAAKETISRALLLTWPVSPFNVVLQSSPDMTTWTMVSATPTLVGTSWQVYQPVSGQLYYRLTTP